MSGMSPLGGSNPLGPSGNLVNNPGLLQALYPGLDLTAFAQMQQEQTAALELPLQNLTAQVSQLNSVSQAWSSVESAVTALMNDATTLTQASTWSAPTATTNNSNVVTAAASSSASPGNYLVDVTQQGKYDQWLSQGETSNTSALNLSGSFTIGGKSVSVTSSDTLQTIAQKINALNAGATATVLSGTNGSTTSYYLALDSTSYEKLTLTDPSGILYGTGTSGLGMAEQQTGQPWVYTVNGASTQSTTGTDSTTVPGLTLTLTGLSASSTSPTTITVTASNSNAQAALNQFASDYNALEATISQVTGKGQILQGDPTASSIMQSIDSALLGTNSANPIGFQSASDAGLTLSLQKDFTTKLSFSATTFQSAANQNASALQSLFTGTSGIATQLQSLLQNLGGASTGTIAGIQTNIQTQISDLTNQETQEQSLITLQQNALQAQFSQEMNALIAVSQQKNSISSLLSGLMNGGSSSSSNGSTGG